MIIQYLYQIKKLISKDSNMSIFQKELNSSQAKTKHIIQSNRPSQCLRIEQRSHHIENIKKAARYYYNVEQTIQYLLENTTKTNEVEQIIAQAIHDENIEVLVQYVVSADSLFKAAVVGQAIPLLNLIQMGLKTRPSAILLLGNLCALYNEFIEQGIKRKMITHLTIMIEQLKSNTKSVEVPAWTLTKLCRQPYYLDQNQVLSSLPSLCLTLSQISQKNQSNNLIRTNIIRVISQYAASVQFPEQFICFFTHFKPIREVDIVNIYIALSTQIKILCYSQNNQARIQLFNQMVWLNNQIVNKTLTRSFYQLLNIIILKSESAVSEYLLINLFSQVILPYKCSSLGYLTLIYNALQKISLIPTQLLDQFRDQDILDNLVHDIRNSNMQIAHKSLKCVHLLVDYLLMQGEISYVQYVLNLGLQEQVQSFIEQVGSRSDHTKLGYKLLDLISRQ